MRGSIPRDLDLLVLTYLGKVPYIVGVFGTHKSTLALLVWLRQIGEAFLYHKKTSLRRRRHPSTSIPPTIHFSSGRNKTQVDIYKSTLTMKESSSPLNTSKLKRPLHLNFVSVAEGVKHSIGITADGVAYSWGTTNALGQLGRVTKDDDPKDCKVPAPIQLSTLSEDEKEKEGRPTKVIPVLRAYVGGSMDDSGHSALMDVSSGTLWMAGCDRWQQLGLGASEGGSSGYTWRDGKLWQEKFVPSTSVTDLMRKHHSADGGLTSTSSQPQLIRDVALGGDHTLVLASNRRDVYAFGKGGDGQLGLIGKPFVSAPVKSVKLSVDGASAVCAVKACSMVFDDKGKRLAKAGKCRSSDAEIRKGIESCLKRAAAFGLVDDSS